MTHYFILRKGDETKVVSDGGDGHDNSWDSWQGPFDSLAEAERAQAEYEALGSVCTWAGYDESDQWETDCGRTFSLIDGGPAENRYTYCPGCGRRIEDVSKFEEDDE